MTRVLVVYQEFGLVGVWKRGPKYHRQWIKRCTVGAVSYKFARARGMGMSNDKRGVSQKH